MSRRGQTFSVLLLAFAAASAVSGSFKRWIQNTNFDNRLNWNLGRRPCGNDRVLIPDDSPVIFVQTNTTLSQLGLPKTGELILGKNMVLSFGNTPDYSANCLKSGENLEFNATYPREWTDPANWCTASTETGACEQDPPLLDSETIPCATDHVVFPPGNSFYVDLESKMPLVVNTFKFLTKAFSTNTLALFLKSQIGKMYFSRPKSSEPSTITIRRRKCVDPTGCACGNDKKPILERICEKRSPLCEKPGCRSAIIPGGSCCEICGGLLGCEYGSGFKLQTLENAIRRNFLEGKEENKGVKLIASKMSSGKVQIVITDKSGDASSRLAEQIKKLLDEDIATGGSRYALRAVILRMSGPSHYKSTTPGFEKRPVENKEKLSPGTVFAVIFCVFSIVILVIVFIFLYRKGTLHRFVTYVRSQEVLTTVRGRFTKPDSSVPMETLQGQSDPPANVDGFDNPMYGSPQFDKPDGIEYCGIVDLPTFDCTQDTGFNNPLYGSPQQKSLYADASKSPGLTLNPVYDPSEADETNI